MKTLSWFTLTLALAALPMTAQGGPAWGHDHGPRADRMARVLKLSDAQKASIQAVHDKHHQAIALRREAVRQAQAALRTAARDAATPEAQLRALFDKASAARFDMMLARRSVHQEVQSLLTPEQQALAADLRSRAQARGHERSHPRHGGHRGMGQAG